MSAALPAAVMVAEFLIGTAACAAAITLLFHRMFG